MQRLQRSQRGRQSRAYNNLVNDDPSPQAVWLPAFAKFVSAPEPPHMSETEVTAIAGEDVVYYQYSPT